MARQFKITNGTDEVDLIKAGTPGIMAKRGGFGASTFAPHQISQGGGLDSVLFQERWQLAVKGSSHDNIATQTRALYKLLRQAYKYHNDPREVEPVYLVQQTTNETNARYALVYMSPEISEPDKFADLFEFDDYLDPLGVSIQRFIWRSNAPGVLGSALSLTPTNGAAGQTIFVGNERSNYDITWIYNYDSSATAYSSNYAASSSFTLFEVSGSTPAAGDMVYIGITTRGAHNVIFYIGTALVASSLDLVVEYYNGATWATLTPGDNLTIYDSNDENTLFDSTGDWAISWNATDWAVTTVNGSAGYWIRIRIVSVSAWTTSPAVSTYEPYTQRTPWITIPAATLKGDDYPILNLRLHSPGCGDADEAFSNISRIIIGAKKTPGDFEAVINCSNPIATGWSAADNTDTSGTVDAGSPRGEHKTTTFATDDTMVTRVTMTGSNVLDDYRGSYRILYFGQQTGGAAGDVTVRLRVRLVTTTAYFPNITLESLSSQSYDSGIEVFDFGTLQIPFTTIANADVLSSGEIVIEIQASRASGSSAQLEHMAIGLIPADGWVVDLDDHMVDSISGASALRGQSILDLDGGVLAERTTKLYNDGTNFIPVQDWSRGGPPIQLDPGYEHDLHFIFLHYGTWGDAPWFWDPAVLFKAELYGHMVYYGMRGSD